MKRDRRYLYLQDIGCIACRIESALDGRIQIPEPSDMHHLLNGGKRVGDHATIALCPYHHRGIRTNGAVGPTVATSARAFASRYGTQSTLLALTDELLEIYIDGLQNRCGNADALIEVSARVEQYAVRGVMPED